MKAVIQRVTKAEVQVDGERIGSIGLGLLVLLGVAAGDTEKEVAELVEKICFLRIFGDESGKMNLSLRDVEGSMLVVSQFTLLADTRKGRRPSFIAAAHPTVAEALYQRFVSLAQAGGVRVQTGRFGAHMEVSLINDGPVTLVLEASPS